MNDREKKLVEMVLAGKKEAFEPLVLPYRASLLNLAFRMTGNMEDAKEAAQETLMRAFKYLRRYEPERSFRNWIYGILVNEARKLRADRVNAPLSLETEAGTERALAANGPTPGDAHAARETRSQLMECLMALTAREKEIFLMRDIEELSIAEAAKALGTSSISVRVNLSRARKKMKEVILTRYPHLVEGIR
ncbi:MAG: RNA polymerase sigma factor [Candidatus Aminicenantes bacterium]|nr:RNA polymerase sigma factor [Candidatus Aminicenantes bacterium]